MLEQFVTVTQGVLAPALLVMALSATLGIGEGRDRPISARWRWWGLALGLVAAVIFAGLRASAVINQRTFVNFPVLLCAVFADAMTVVIVVRSRTITTQWRDHRTRIHAANAIATLTIALTVFYALPDVILKLTAFVEPGDPVFTSDMLLRALGFLLGLLAAIVTAAIIHTLHTPATRKAFTVAAAGLVLLLFAQHLTALLQLMHSSMIMIHGAQFRILVWFINHGTMLTMAQVWVFAIPMVASVIAGARMSVNVPDKVDARRHRALRRRAFAAAAFSLVAMIGVSLTLTLGVAQINKVPTLSPPESYALVDGVATISFAQVEDGHLHRFEYTAKDGTVMRFIIIKKNGGAYGVGLDACENCGDAGYYEKDGKIICKKCDVAINLATIGFKGGCNPIPFPYESDNGTITINTADLDALSGHFA